MGTSALDKYSAPVDAGEFGAWLLQALASFRGGVGMQVPCGDCRACCTSSYFVHVRPDEQLTLAIVPKRLLVNAPGLPPGHMLIGIAADGSCPLLRDRECSIYQGRPRTCRDYDCRVFAAAGIDAGGPEKEAINLRVRAWKFTYATAQDLRAHDAVKDAASFLQNNRDSFPGGRSPTAPSEIAVLAIKVHRVFLMPDAKSRLPIATAQAVMRASREFEASR